MTVGFFVVPVAFTRSVFRPSDAARLPIPQLRGYSVLAASPPAVLRASRSRFPAVRQFGPGAATRTRAGTPTERRTGADLRCTQPLPASTTRPPVLPPPPSSATPAHSNHPPARNLQPDYRPESSRLARSHSPDPSRNPDRSRNPEPGPQPDYTIKGRSSPTIHHSRTTVCSAPAALRSRARALPPSSFLLPRCPSQPNTGPSLLPLVPPPSPPPSPRAGHKKTPARCRAGVGFTENGRITSRSSRRSP